MLPTGRFAPSPTGPLHMGSLLAATASFLDIRVRSGCWLLRIDDLDTFRNEPGAEADILRALDAHGLHWEGAPIRQSERTDRYQAALDDLTRTNLTFSCTCSRRSLRGSPVYPGTCRGSAAGRPDAALRVVVGDSSIEFADAILGPQAELLAHSVGDFIVRRRDGLFAYQLATAVDDGGADITHVLRGSDLLDNTARQIFLMQLLGLQPPQYAHVPTLLSPCGGKLSKQTKAPAVQICNASANLAEVLHLLGLQPPDAARAWPVADLISWGIAHWNIDDVPRHDTVYPA